METNRPCRICDKPIGRVRTELGHSGCVDCEILWLKAQIAEGVLTGRMPDWWVDPAPFDEADAARRVYDALSDRRNVQEALWGAS